MKKNIVIITGGPGFGKTKIIQELEKKGFVTGREFARDLIDEQVEIDGEILPWKNLLKFQQEVLKQRIDFYNSVNEETWAFSDRGIPDQMAFAIYRGFQPSRLLKESVIDYPYFKTVFITPPWKEIYTTDSIRKESFDNACQLHQTIYEIYQELNYELVEIPKTNPEERARFIINYLTN